MAQVGSEVRIARDDVGSGEPSLLFLPGWAAERTMFRDLLPVASAHRRAIALDWRGHGESGIPAGDYGTEELVQDALSVLGDTGVQVVVPVAVAHAGWVALELRRRLGPTRVPGLVLLDWMVLGPPPPFLAALAGLQDPEQWLAVRDQLFAMWTSGLDLPALDAHIAAMARYGFDTWARAGREIAARFAAEQSPVAALERLTPACPVLHVYAQPADDETLRAQEAYGRAHPWFSVHRLRAASHFPMFEDAAGLAAVVEGFVQEL